MRLSGVIGILCSARGMDELHDAKSEIFRSYLNSIAEENSSSCDFAEISITQGPVDGKEKEVGGGYWG